MKLALKSPKPTQVKNVLAESGAEVTCNQPLIELYDYEEQKILSTIAAAIDENESKAAELRGPRVEAKLARLGQIVEDRRKSVDAAQVYYEEVIDGYRVGNRSVLDVLQARAGIGLKTFQIL